MWHHDESRFTPTIEELEARYRDVIDHLGGAGRTAPFARVYAAWAADDRRYHSVEHLIDCLRELDRADVASSNRDLVELALWYHDIVYEPQRRDNEERSAQTLLADAELVGMPLETAMAAADLVRATAHASASSGTPAADLVLDIDLSILGRDVLRFLDYEYSVAEEYRDVSTIRFRIARGRFLASLLARPHLFRTAAFRDRYEQRARTQIAALLASSRYRCYRWTRWAHA